MSPTTWQKLDQIAFYEIDDFSEEQTTANRQKAKERAEVSDDTGYETVRTDILIDQNTCIEAKCSRDSMSEKKLGEEIKADMVQYTQKNIYFFIYNKSKIIKNPLLFKEEYEKMEPNKNIYIFIHQPKKL